MWSPKRHVFISLLFILKCFSKPFVIRSFNSRKENFVSDRLRSALPPFDICCIQETVISDPVFYRSFASRWRGRCYWSPSIGRGEVLLFLFLNPLRVIFPRGVEILMELSSAFLLNCIMLKLI